MIYPIFKCVCVCIGICTVPYESYTHSVDERKRGKFNPCVGVCFFLYEKYKVVAYGEKREVADDYTAVILLFVFSVHLVVFVSRFFHWKKQDKNLLKKICCCAGNKTLVWLHIQQASISSNFTVNLRFFLRYHTKKPNNTSKNSKLSILLWFHSRLYI